MEAAGSEAIGLVSGHDPVVSKTEDSRVSLSSRR